MSQSELSEADILTAVGAIVRRRNRVGADDERGSIALSCEHAATMLVVNALREGGLVLSRIHADRGGEEVEVKALEFVTRPGGLLFADTPFDYCYCVNPRTNMWLGPTEDWTVSDDPIAACQADYTARIRSALATTTE